MSHMNRIRMITFCVIAAMAVGCIVLPESDTHRAWVLRKAEAVSSTKNGIRENKLITDAELVRILGKPDYIFPTIDDFLKCFSDSDKPTTSPDEETTRQFVLRRLLENGMEGKRLVGRVFVYSESAHFGLSRGNVQDPYTSEVFVVSDGRVIAALDDLWETAFLKRPWRD